MQASIWSQHMPWEHESVISWVSNEGEADLHLHSPVRGALYFLIYYLLRPRECVRLCTRRIYQTRLLPFFFFFYDADTDGDASVYLAASEAYLHMTLRSAIGEMGIRRVLFCWNDVLLPRMWQQNMNMKIWKEQLSQHRSWYSWGLDIMCLLAWLLMVLYIMSLDCTACVGLRTLKSTMHAAHFTYSTHIVPVHMNNKLSCGNGN